MSTTATPVIDLREHVPARLRGSRLSQGDVPRIAKDGRLLQEIERLEDESQKRERKEKARRKEERERAKREGRGKRRT